MKIIIEIGENEARPSVVVDPETQSFDGGVFDAPEADVHVSASGLSKEILVDVGPAGDPLELDTNGSVTDDEAPEEQGEGK